MSVLTAPLKVLSVPSVAKHTATVIFVHGLGDTGYGWQPVADMLKVNPELQHVKWVLPHAPTRPVTANGGLAMPSWFDILSFDFKTAEDESGMLQSSRLLNELVSAEVDSGIDANRIVLGGFSQGGAMSLLTGLTSERKLGGIAVLSGWLPLHNKFKSMTSQHAKSLPIFWGHGSGDPLVKYELCTKSVEYLKTTCGIPELGAGDESNNGIRCKVYRGMAHTSCPEELNDLKVWLSSVIPVDGGSK